MPDPAVSARGHWERQAAEWVGLTQADPHYDLVNKPAFLERYFRAFESAGLAVSALREPRPSDELAASGSDFANQQRVPGFLHVVARHLG